MTRKAVLIAVPNSPGLRPLSGPPVDLHIVYNYLRSETGGGWNKNEISVLEDPTWHKAITEINSLERYDVSYIYFSGHGGSVNGKDFICLGDGKRLIIEEIVKIGKKRFVIIDACRGRVEPITEGFAGIGDIPSFDFGNPSVGRRKFDNWMSTVGNGIILIQACKQGELSYDSTGGGVFTKNFYPLLYDLARNCELVMINDAIVDIRDQLKGYEQTPIVRFSHSWREILLPIAISS